MAKNNRKCCWPADFATQSYKSESSCIYSFCKLNSSCTCCVQVIVDWHTGKDTQNRPRRCKILVWQAKFWSQAPMWHSSSNPPWLCIGTSMWIQMNSTDGFSHAIVNVECVDDSADVSRAETVSNCFLAVKQGLRVNVSTDGVCESHYVDRWQWEAHILSLQHVDQERLLLVRTLQLATTAFVCLDLRHYYIDMLMSSVKYWETYLGGP